MFEPLNSGATDAGSITDFAAVKSLMFVAASPPGACVDALTGIGITGHALNDD